MSELAVTNTYSDGDVVDATKFNTNYTTDIAGYINDRNSGSESWDLMRSEHATNVPMTANNSTGTQSSVQMKDNGTVAFEVFDGGICTYSQEAADIYATFNTQVFAKSTVTKVTFAQSVVTQVHSNMDSAGKYTCASNGKYMITVRLEAQPIGGTWSGTDLGTVHIYKNGAQISKRASVRSTTAAYLYIQDIVSLAVNDYIEIYITVNDSTNAGVVIGSSGSEQRPTRYSIQKVA